MILQDEIKQKAEEYSKRECPVNGEHYNQTINTGDLVLYAKNDFTAGANFILDKLRWKDPKEELPEKYYDVLVKIECETSGVFYLIGYTVDDNTWRLYYGDGISMESEGRTIVGWRNIIEL